MEGSLISPVGVGVIELTPAGLPTLDVKCVSCGARIAGNDFYIMILPGTVCVTNGVALPPGTYCSEPCTLPPKVWDAFNRPRDDR